MKSAKARFDLGLWSLQACEGCCHLNLEEMF